MKNIIKKECCKEKRVDKNGNEYIPFRTDVYFSEYNLVDEKGLTDRVLSFEKKRQEALEKTSLLSLLELILRKKIMMHFMKLVE